MPNARKTLYTPTKIFAENIIKIIEFHLKLSLLLAMSFVYPAFLWALFVLSIPIAIHLFNFRKVKKIYFTNVRFLKELKTETNSFKSIRELLILMMRLGAFAALVFAFAQPFLPNQDQKSVYNVGAVVSIYLDNSYSMQNELSKKKYLSWAKESISDIVKTLPKSANFLLTTNDFRNREQFFYNAAKIEDLLSETTFSGKVRNLESVYNRQETFLKRNAKNEKNQLFWVSDFQKSTVGDLSKIRVDTNHYYYIVPVKSDMQSNMHIDTAWLSNPFVKEGEQNNLNFVVQNHSENPQEELSVKLYINDLQVSATTLSVGAGGKASANFTFTTQGRGSQKAKIVIEDEPISFDNDYYFTLNIAPSVRIAHVYEGGGNMYIRNVYTGEKSFRVESYDVAGFDTRILSNIDLLILDNLGTIPNNISELLKAFTESGRSLLVFPAAGIEANSYSKSLGDLGVRGLKTEVNDSLGKNTSKVLLPPNLNNTFYEGIFEQTPNNIEMPFANATISWMGVNSQLMGFKNGKNFLSEFKNGRGKVYVCASPLEARYTNFPLSPLFLPIMYKIAARSSEQNGRLAYGIGERNITLKVPKSDKNRVFKLKNAQTEIIPAQDLQGEQLSLELPEQGMEAGYYDLLSNEGQNAGVLAFNYDRKESDLQTYSVADLKKIFSNRKNVQVYENIENKKFVEDFKNKNVGTSLWKYFVWAALAFLLAEVLIIRFLKSSTNRLVK